MKKRLFIILALLAVTFTSTYAYEYEVRRNPSSEEYYLDRKIREAKNNSHSYAGIITRFGYGFNYDAFTYGASLLYHFDSPLGVSIGFDGYYIPDMYAELSDGSLTKISDHKFPLWDLRAGLMLGKYFAFGGLCGKWMIDNSNVINMRENAWFTSNKDSKVMYGGWITFILPIGKYFGLNMDFAVTNKTGFNIGAGINFTLPVK